MFLFFDIDGTLFDDDRRLPKAVCTFVTDRPEEHGIRNAMKHFEFI